MSVLTGSSACASHWPSQLLIKGAGLAECFSLVVHMPCVPPRAWGSLAVALVHPFCPHCEES